MGVWGDWPCTAVTPTCTGKEAGSNGVGFSMDTRLLGPKGMNGLKILSSTRLLAQTNLPPGTSPAAASVTVLTHNWAAHPPTPTTAHPQNSRYTPRCPSVVLWTPCSGVEWRVFEPAVKGGKAARRASSLRTWR